MEEKIRELTAEQDWADDDEDAIDAAIAEEAYREYVESGYKSTRIEEFWAELDME